MRRIPKSAKYADQGTKVPRNSMSPKRINALEESQEQRFFSCIICAASRRRQNGDYNEKYKTLP